MNERFDLFRDPSTKWYMLGSLIALEVLVSVSFLGYIHIEPISITFAYIPILITGMVMGPAHSTLVGAVFGLISMGKASASYVMAGDRIFSPFMSGSPLKSVLLSVGMRALFGLLAWLLYDLAKKHSRHVNVWIGVISFFGKSLHSLLVYSGMALLFPELGYSASSAFSGFFTAENILVASGTAAAVLLLRRGLCSRPFQRFEQRMAMAKKLRAEDGSPNRTFLAYLAVVFCLTCAVTIYYVHRTRYMLRQHQVAVSDEFVSDLFLLQAQFLIGILALAFLLSVFQAFYRKHAACVEYEARLDTLTGVCNRQSFFRLGRQRLAEQETPCGCFIMLDVDRFKAINDAFGHPEGDRVLHDIAKCLRDVFAPSGLLGRLGGDEFAVFIDQPVEREHMEHLLRLFAERVDRLNGPSSSLSCSIGVLIIPPLPTTIEELYKKADRLLYLAKQQGRNRYIFGE